MRLKRTFLLLFLLLAGIVFGALLAAVCSDVSFLSWMSFSRTVGISPDTPLVLDVSVARMAFGFTTSISVAQVLCIALAVVIYNVVTKRR